MRDAIRRRLGIVPAVDAGGREGDPVATYPWPSNKAINAAIDEALAEINREAELTRGTEQEWFLQPQSEPGPASLPRVMLQRPGSIQEAYWYCNGRKEKLKPSTREEMARDNKDWLNTPPGTPTTYVDGTQYIWIWPAPASPGSVIFYVSNPLVMPDLDDATVTELPLDYLPIICDMAAAALALSVPDDDEMLTRAQAYVAKAQEGKLAILKHISTRAKEHTPHVQVRSYRWH